MTRIRTDKMRKPAAAILLAVAMIASGTVDAKRPWLSGGDAPAVAAANIPAAGPVSIYFSPNGGAERAVVDEINRARLRILVQAYSFTSAPIYEALAVAKARGVDVRVLVDKEARDAGFKGAGARYDMARGIPILVDEIGGRGIAHSKVMVIDAATVITGSFNFSRQAETTNSENLLVFHSSPELVAAYTKAWQVRASGAVQY
jgi:phosphatidylserine/phosphatidylglycerophosphate/cardiolipin synthase-like enzyme